MKKIVFFSLGILAFTLLQQKAAAQAPAGNSESNPGIWGQPWGQSGGGWIDLFTTVEDFTGWRNGWGGSTILPTAGYSYDSDAVNGYGNTNAGAAGTSGSLKITWNGGGGSQWSLVANTPDDPNPGGNQYFMTALDPGSSVAGNSTVAYSGLMQIFYSVPDNEGGSYFHLEVLFQYAGNGYWGTFGPGTVTDTLTQDPNGYEVYSTQIPYTINAGQIGGFNFGIIMDEDYGPLDPFYIDDIEVAVPEPGTAALFGLGTLGFAFLARRRRA